MLLSYKTERLFCINAKVPKVFLAVWQIWLHLHTKRSVCDMNDTKKHILQVAFKLFLQKSFKEVTMNEIVTETKLSKGAFYHHFSSKEELFAEVIDRYYLEFAKIDFTRFSHESLKDFMRDYQAGMEVFATAVLDGGLESVTMNYFIPMIDALRMLPYFRDRIAEARRYELNAWVKIIRIARKKGEIKSGATNEQLARLFIYTGDGAGVGLMALGKSGEMVKEVKQMWNAIYISIKTS